MFRRKEKPPLFKQRYMIVNGLLLLALLGGLWAGHAGSASSVKQDFLAPLDMQYRDWGNIDLDLNPEEARQMQPDALFFRRYESESDDGGEIELAVIAGSRKKTVHTPAYCMPGSGWEILSQKTVEIPLKGRTLN